MKRLFQITEDDLGVGNVTFQWSPSGSYLAAAGSKRKVNVYDRNGKLYGEIHLHPPEVPVTDPQQCCCLHLQWDASGDFLAVLPSGSSLLYVWAAATRDVQKMETDFRAQELSGMTWGLAEGTGPGRSSSSLAVATVKGNLQLFNLRDKRRTPIVGKHAKRVSCMCWNKENVIATASLDKTVSFCDGTTGDTFKVVKFRGEPLQLCVGDVKDESGGRGASSWSMITSKKVMHIIQGEKDAREPLELSFQDSYGAMVQHLWFGDGYILVGFESGQVVVVSSLSKEMGQEVHSNKMLDVLSTMAYCPALAVVAVAGGSSVKVMSVGAEYGEVKGDAIELGPGQVVGQVGWSKDGQVLTVASTSGQVSCYLASLPTVYGVHGAAVAQLTSLSEVILVDTAAQRSIKVAVECEPAFCAVGPSHVAVGMNNQVLFYSWSGQGATSSCVARREYLGGVSSLYLNATHAALLVEGKLLVHPIEVAIGHSLEESDACLPPVGMPGPLVCAGISQHFVVTGTACGALCYYVVEDLAPVNEYRHPGGGILKVFPQPSGPRAVFEDTHHQVFLYSPVNDHTLPLPDYGGSSVQVVLWDAGDPHVFLVGDGQALYQYKYLSMTVTGPRLVLLSKAGQPASHTPVVLRNRVVTCRLRNGALDHLRTGGGHSTDQPNKSELQRRFSEALQLMHLPEAWQAAAAMRSPEAWQQLGRAALELLDVETGLAAFRQAGDASMVLSLGGLRWVSDRNLLSGHLLVLMERDNAQAQELFLRSSRPLAALEMRKDLKHWQEALTLAQQLAPESVASLSKEHAALLEMVGEHQQARAHYQQALAALHEGSEPALQLACRCGLARTHLHLGNIGPGRELAQQVNSTTLYKECGLILEGMQQLGEAADMYERGGMVEKAASIHISAKNWAAAGPLMGKVASAKLQVQFAKVQEADRRWAEAAAAYEAAGDVDNVVRLCLEKLDAVPRACALVRKTRTRAAAGTIARYCLSAGDPRGAVEFLLLAGQLDQAFDIAAAQGEMDAFAKLVEAGSNGGPEAERIAKYYEKRGELEKAGGMWAQAGQPGRALDLLLRAGTAAGIGQAIALLEGSKGSNTSGQATQVLAALEQLPLEGPVKEELRLRCHLAAGQLVQAGRAALELAQLEQAEGNYKLAHAQLFNTVRQMELLGSCPPSELTRALALLHSYILVKTLVGLNDHEGAARMLIRVANSISKFPKHVVPILTSTVIECQRAGLKKTSLEHAMTLMRPEYRLQVVEKHRKKIELMVRKPDRGEQPEEATLPCAFCHLPGAETNLQCVSCQNNIPFDIATGKRMCLSDWCECPSCRFPCSGQAFLRVLQMEQRCPMCGQEVASEAVRQVPDPLLRLRRNGAQLLS